jgi:hypothetical protein
MVRHYATVAAKLTNQSELMQGADSIRNWLEQMPDPHEGLLLDYGTIAAQFTDQIALKGAAAYLRKHLMQETNRSAVATLAKAHAAVATRDIEIARAQRDATAIATRVREILMLSGHPFLDDAAELLALLEPISGRRFGKDVGAAIGWWIKEYTADPVALRPVPTTDRQVTRVSR